MNKIIFALALIFIGCKTRVKKNEPWVIEKKSYLKSGICIFDGYGKNRAPADDLHNIRLEGLCTEYVIGDTLFFGKK